MHPEGISYGAPAVKFSSRLDLEQVSEVRDSEKSHFWTGTKWMQ